MHALLAYRALRCVIGRGASLAKRQERRGPACIWQKDQTGVSEKRKTMRSSLVARRELGYSLLAVSPRVARSHYWSSDRFGGLFRAFPKTTGERTKRGRREEGKGTDRQNRIDARYVTEVRQVCSFLREHTCEGITAVTIQRPYENNCSPNLGLASRARYAFGNSFPKRFALTANVVGLLAKLAESIFLNFL